MSNDNMNDDNNKSDIPSEEAATASPEKPRVKRRSASTTERDAFKTAATAAPIESAPAADKPRRFNYSLPPTDVPVHRPGVPRGRAMPEARRPSARPEAPRHAGDGAPHQDRPRRDDRGPSGDNRDRRDGRRDRRPDSRGEGAQARDGGSPRQAPGAPQQHRAVPTPEPARAPAPVAPVPLHAKRAQAIIRATKPNMTAKEALAQKVKKPSDDAPAPTEAVAFAVTAEMKSANWETARAHAAKATTPAAADTLIDAWLEASNAAAIASVADLAEGAGPARKAARRALGTLRARNIEIPAAPVATTKVESPTVFPLEATFLAPDPTGAYSLTFSQRDPSGRIRVAEVIIRDSVGILQAVSGWTSASALKEGHKKASDTVGTLPVAVPLAWARYRVALAKGTNATSGRVLPLGYDKCKPLVEPAEASAPPHPMSELEKALDAAAVKTAAEASKSLHEFPEFQGWIAERSAVDELLATFGEKLGPTGNEDRDRANSLLTEETASATNRFFNDQRRALIASRMRDSAMSVRLRRGETAAKAVLAVAKAVEASNTATASPSEIPFLLGFFQKAIAWMSSQNGGGLRVPMKG